nr:MAG TPA: hypothetical protein [Caudoviricetes sp.]
MIPWQTKRRKHMILKNDVIEVLDRNNAGNTVKWKS